MEDVIPILRCSQRRVTLVFEQHTEEHSARQPSRLDCLARSVKQLHYFPCCNRSLNSWLLVGLHNQAMLPRRAPKDVNKQTIGEP